MDKQRWEEAKTRKAEERRSEKRRSKVTKKTGEEKGRRKKINVRDR